MTGQIPAITLFAKGLDSLSNLRKAIRNYLLTLVALSLLIFLCSPDLLSGVQQHLGSTLYFFSVAGPFLAHVKLAVFGAILILAPWGIFLFWQFIGGIFGIRRLLPFSLFSCLLFYMGAIFCYLVTLPYGIEFLLGFGSEQLQPVISVGRCINFITIFIFAFALVFELPVLMVFFVQVRLFSVQTYRKNRRYAVLLIATLAAVLTPTPDVVNMALMGVPLYLLYEAGIGIVCLMESADR